MVALLRGINNVGRKRVAMSTLEFIFESMGFTNVRTVLASGNVIFEAARKGPHPGQTIALGLEKALGFPVTIFIRTVRELRAIVRSEPFKDVPPVPDVQRYVTFLSGKRGAPSTVRLPTPPQGVRVARVDPGEIFSVVLPSLGGRTPDLMRYLDRALGPKGTTRNWRTVVKIVGGTAGTNEEKKGGKHHGL
jgi:uncharacterized protein (DUF1697 family)